MDITLKINGEVQALSVDPRVSLLDALRERLHLTGTKEGCNQGACGACLTLAVMHDGAERRSSHGSIHVRPRRPRGRSPGGRPPPARMYIFPAASAPPQPFGWTVARSYSTRIAIGVVVRSTTRKPPPRSVTNVRRSVESMTGQRGHCPAGGRDPRTPPRSASGTAPGRASRPAPG
jgi:hypothetical protein